MPTDSPNEDVAAERERVLRILNLAGTALGDATVRGMACKAIKHGWSIEYLCGLSATWRTAITQQGA